MIKVFIIAAETLDGFIAKDSGHSPFLWTSKEDKQHFVEQTRRAGVVVMGSTTFKTLPRPMKERVNIVYSKSQNFEGAETTQDDPITLIKKLEERGFKEVAICGGSSIYTMFLKAGIVDEIYMTIEPVIFGSGMSLLTEDINVQLKLEESHTTEHGTIFTKYKVLNTLI
ncbi:MAG: dihydrofolate reductase family protein [Patescibacteria group bacterium]